MAKKPKQLSDEEKSKLEAFIENKVNPLVEQTMKRYLGVNINELNKDLSEKLTKDPLVEFDINLSIPFKVAKVIFKRQYLKKLLLLNYGNVTEVSRIAGMDRRSIHRIVPEKEIEKIREEMIKPYEVKQKTVSSIVENVLQNYKMVIHPEKIKQVYTQIGDLSKDILEELPLKEMTMGEAENMFERKYLKLALEQAKGSISKMAKMIKIRYETLHRKLKKLGMI